MAPKLSPDDSSSIKNYVVKVARLPQYFNQFQRILRIEFGSDPGQRYFDFLLTDSNKVPNNKNTVAILQTYESILLSDKYAMFPGDPRLDLPPGYLDQDTFDPSQLPNGFITDILSQYTTIYGSVNPDGDTGLKLRSMDDPSNWENIQISLHGHLPASYTKTKEQMDGDPVFSSYGVTVGNNFTQVTGPGANGITMGPDSTMVFSGDIHYQKSKGSQGMVGDNPLAGWIPATIMTAPLAIQWIPNIDAIATFGALGQRVAKGARALTKLTESANSLRA